MGTSHLPKSDMFITGGHPRDIVGSNMVLDPYPLNFKMSDLITVFITLTDKMTRS